MLRSTVHVHLRHLSTVTHCQVGGHSLVGVHQVQESPEEVGVTTSHTDTSAAHLDLHHFDK